MSLVELETVWTYAQFRYVLRGVRLNQAAEEAALEAAREGRAAGTSKAGGGTERPLTVAEASAVSQFLPASMVAEAVWKE